MRIFIRELNKHRDPFIFGPSQVLLVLGVVGQQLDQQHGLDCADWVAQSAQEFEFKIVQEGLQMQVRKRSL